MSLSSKYKFGPTIVEITGDHPVADLIRSEYQSMAAAPEIKSQVIFNFIPEITFQDPIVIKDVLLVDDQYMGRPFKSGFAFKINNDSLTNEIIKVDIAIEKRVIPSNFIKKIIYAGYYYWNWSHLTTTEIAAKNIIYGIFDAIIHQLMLAKGSVFCHAASIEKEGKAYILSGFGGSGKTGLSSELIFNRNFKFLSDDFALISSNGKAYYYGKKAQIYAYNTENNPLLYKNLMANRNLLDKLMWHFRKKYYGPKKVRRRMRPEDIFGKERIGKDSPIDGFYFLMRGKVNQPSYIDLSAEEIAQRNTSVIADEINYFLNLCDLWHAANYKAVPQRQILNQTFLVYKEILEKVRKKALIIFPKDYNPTEMADFFIQNIK